MTDYFNRIYEKWYSWFSYLYDPFLKIMFFFSNGGLGGERRLRESVIDLIDPMQGEKILDMGSGTGTLAIMLGKGLSGGEVVGVEISRDQLRVARRKGRPSNVRFIEGDARRTIFNDEYFDKCVLFGVLHELPRDVRTEVLAEAIRILKGGGLLVSFEHNIPSRRWLAVLQDVSERFNPEYKTYRDLMKHGLTEEIESAGFEVLRRETRVHDMAELILAQKLG